MHRQKTHISHVFGYHKRKTRVVYCTRLHARIYISFSMPSQSGVDNLHTVQLHHTGNKVAKTFFMKYRYVIHYSQQFEFKC